MDEVVPASSAELIELILSGIQPPEGPWRELGTEGVAFVLAGAGAAAVQLTQLIDEHAEDSVQSCSVEDVLAAIAARGRAGGPFVWGGESAMRVWSIGYFLNRIFHNVSAALDRCINTWLAREHAVEVGDKVFTDHFMGMWPTTKLPLLQTLLRMRGLDDEDALLAVTELEYACGENWAGTRGAEEWLCERTAQPQQLTRNPLASAFATVFRDASLNLELTRPGSASVLKSSRRVIQARCAVIANARTNAFKHEPHGMLKERNLARFLLEAALGMHATLYVAGFWKVMVRSARRPKCT